MHDLPPHMIRRIAKEIESVRSDASETKLTIEPVNGDQDLTHLKASFPGPADSPYEGGTFWVDIVIGPKYPFRPPKMQFITKIWHPNVSSQTGYVCLDILDKAWSPIMTLRSALISLQSLLCEPQPFDPQDAEVATMHISEPGRYARVAREWTLLYAGAPLKPGEADPRAPAPDATPNRGYAEEVIETFVPMGFSVAQIVDALEAEGIPPGKTDLTPTQLENLTIRMVSANQQ
ncbi:hypothetical protein KEM52_003090 [Ascosphaera acerosa]|nr:hypothetical protein KEM52_003090 [Ascosphaera acerosa]